jgi:hypothetical protein
VANFGFGSDTAYYANVFTSVGNEQVKAVGFYTSATDTQYEVKVFLNPDSGPISSAGYSSEQNGTISLPGYHTIRLDNPVSIKKGDRFSVAVKVVSAGWTTPVAIELPISGYSSGATASSGQSYISSDGAGWSDLTVSEPNTNVCLKAFTISGSTPATGTKVTSTGWQNLKNFIQSPITVKNSIARIYLNSSYANQTNPVSRALAGQVATRNVSQSFVPATESFVSRYQINTGNISSTTSSARQLLAKYQGAD